MQACTDATPPTSKHSTRMSQNCKTALRWKAPQTLPCITPYKVPPSTAGPQADWNTKLCLHASYAVKRRQLPESRHCAVAPEPIPKRPSRVAAEMISREQAAGCMAEVVGDCRRDCCWLLHLAFLCALHGCVPIGVLVIIPKAIVLVAAVLELRTQDRGGSLQGSNRMRCSSQK